MYFAPHSMREIVAFIVTGLCFGAADGLARGGVHAALFAAALTATPAALAGVVAWAAARGAARVPQVARRVARLRARLDALTSRAEGADRDAVLGFHAAVISGALALVVAAAAVGLILRRTWLLDVPGFAIQFSIGAILVAVVVIGAAAAAGTRGVHLLLARLDRRVRIPPPPLAGLRYALFVALPLCAVLVPFTARNQALLGFVRSSVLWLGAMAICAGAARRAWDAARARSARLGRGLAAGAAALWLGLVAVTVTSYEAHEDDTRAIAGSIGATLGADLLRALSDVDRDGASSWLGGGDCAPLDPERSPKAREIRGNGRDEDCDGADSPASSIIPSPQYHGDLPAERVRRYNIVWLIVDAARADHIGAYGYSKPTTPYLDELAAESVLFTRALSQSSRTFFSVPSMFVGANPATMTWERAHGTQQPVDGHVTMAERLGEFGYTSRLILPGGMKKDYTGLQQGYDQVTSYFLDDDWKKWRRLGAAVATTQAIEFIEGAAADPRDPPFFLTIHYIEPHAPYERHHHAYPNFGRGRRSAYDEELASVDRHIGFLLEYLRYRGGLWEDTVVVIAGDHGEEFGEHGHSHHGWTCFIESVHVPLILRVPGVEAARVDTPVGLVDVAPTLLELVGAPQTSDDLHGQSLLVPLYRPDRVDPLRPLFCSTASASGRRYLTRAVRSGSLTLTKDLQHSRFELYDTSTDPGEKRDVLDQPAHADRVEALKSALGQTETGNLKQLW